MKVKIAPEGFVLWGLIILLLPLRWWLAAAIAAVFHEGCHCCAVAACGGHITRIEITLWGVSMESTPLTPKQAFLASLAGPLGGLLLCILLKWIPRIAVCAFLQSVFNLLPLFPLDGGRALVSLLQSCLSPDLAEKVFSVVQNGTAAMLFLLCIFSTLRIGMRFLPLFAGFWLYRWLRERKTTCKDSVSRVQ